jgi:hypothetical protein
MQLLARESSPRSSMIFQHTTSCSFKPQLSKCGEDAQKSLDLCNPKGPLPRKVSIAAIGTCYARKRSLNEGIDISEEIVSGTTWATVPRNWQRGLKGCSTRFLHKVMRSPKANSGRLWEQEWEGSWNNTLSKVFTCSRRSGSEYHVTRLSAPIHSPNAV